ncbi:hypothetical protein [Gracilibacillus halophilus]|nr:hypothetical protein [Gracilibacillus halophilus]
MFVHKVDDELSLKLVERADAPEIFKLTDQCREYLRKWLVWVDDIRSADDTQSFIYQSMKEYGENS